MANREYATQYLIENYPFKGTLTEARLRQLLYLADWKFAIDYSRRLTDIDWQIKDGKPYTDCLLLPKKAQIRNFWNLKLKFNVFRLKYGFTGDSGDFKKKMNVLDFVIDHAAKKHLDDLLEVVCSTYPVLGETDVQKVNLVSIAEKFKQQLHLLESV